MQQSEGVAVVSELQRVAVVHKGKDVRVLPASQSAWRGRSRFAAAFSETGLPSVTPA